MKTSQELLHGWPVHESIRGDDHKGALQMDRISRDELETFLIRQPERCISIFMPTHRFGRETEQDPIRYKNLLQEVEKRLLAKGMRTPDVRALLEPTQALLQDANFWRYLSDGLALFFTADELHTYRLPLAFEELVVIGDRFHIKPLLPFFANDGHFYILALSQNQVRLLEGTRHSVDEINQESLPESMAESLQFSQFQKQLQVRSGGGTAGAMFHGHDPSDEEKKHILHWCHMIDDSLRLLLAGEESPLVLAGVESLLSIYQEANSYPHLVEQGILGNPEELSPDVLHSHAWNLVEPVFRQAEEQARAQFQQLVSAGRTTTFLQDALQAVGQGRVERVFVALGEQTWGTYDAQTQVIHVHPEQQPGDEDLLDLLAIQTLLHGGAVYALPLEQMPEQALLAAVYRY